VEEVFMLRDRPNLTLNTFEKLHSAISQQLHRYNKKDPAMKQQPALPPTMLRKAMHKDITAREYVRDQLLIVAFFFGMRSCEYLKMSGTCMTKIISVKEICFFKTNQKICYHLKTKNAKTSSC